MRKNIVEKVLETGILPIIRLDDLTDAVAIARAILAGGAIALEFTMSNPNAVAAVRQCRAEIDAFAQGDAVIGVGSVLNRDMAKTAVSAGAQFIVAPHTDASTLAYCQEYNIPVMPGALTPTEIQTAWNLGADVVKVFPAHMFGPTYIKDVLAPLPHLKLLATGGVNLDNIGDYFRNGVVAVGVGSNLVDRKLIAAQDWQGLTEQTAVYVAAAQKARNAS